MFGKKKQPPPSLYEQGQVYAKHYLYQTALEDCVAALVHGVTYYCRTDQDIADFVAGARAYLQERDAEQAARDREFDRKVALIKQLLS